MCGEEESHEAAGGKSWQETVVVLAVEGKGFGGDTVSICGGHSRHGQEGRLGHHSRAPQQQWVMAKDSEHGPQTGKMFRSKLGKLKRGMDQ